MSSILCPFGIIGKNKSAIVAGLVVMFLAGLGSARANDWAYEVGDLGAVWGTASNDVFAVGKRGIILHFDGIRWAPMDGGTGDCAIDLKFDGVWGSSGTDVYAVGCSGEGDDWLFGCEPDGGVIYHYDGWRWSASAVGGIPPLNGVWGSSAADVFAVGDNGAILYYDGLGWTPMDSHTTADLQAVWGTSGSDVFAVGDGGTILHYDGGDWTAMSSDVSGSLKAVWGLSGTNVFAVGSGGTILRYNGTQWQTSPGSGSATTEVLTAVWGSTASNIFAVGNQGAVVHFNGTAWSAMESNTAANLAGLWGSTGTIVFAVGDGNTVLRFNGSTWSVQSESTTEDLYDAWGTSENNVFVVGDNGAVVRFNGSGWRSMDSGTSENLRAVWGSSLSSVYAVSDAGSIIHYDGSNWSMFHSGPGSEFHDIWGSSGSDIYVVGEGPAPEYAGRIVHFDGGSWTTQDFDAYDDIEGVWGFGPNDVFAITSYRYDTDPGFGGDYELMGVILHFDGAAWSETEIGPKHWMSSIWGSAPDDLHAVGNVYIDLPGFKLSPDFVHYDGSSWQSVPGDVSHVGHIELHGIYGRSNNDLFAVGSLGGGGYHGFAVLRNTGGTWWVDRYDPTWHSLHGVWVSPAGHVFAVGRDGVILRLVPEGIPPAPGPVWTRKFGGEGGDKAHAVSPTTDGGSIVAGETGSFGAGGTDAWLVKLDQDGTVQWQKALGGSGDDHASSVLQTFDGGYVVAGSTSSYGAGGSDAWILKLDRDGDPLWQNAYGDSGHDDASAVVETGGCRGGYAVLGNTYRGEGEWDYWMLKLNQDGAAEWRKTFPTAGLVSLAPGKGYGYFLSGKTPHAPPGYSDFLVLRVDDEGDVLWAKTFGLKAFIAPGHYNINIEEAAHLCVGKDGGPLLVGKSIPILGNPFVWMLKLNAPGELEWQHIGGGDLSISSVRQNTDGGYIFSGRADWDGFLMKVDKDGKGEWTGVYGGLDGEDREAILSVGQTPDGGYVAGGWTSSFYTDEEDLWVLRLDESGLVPDCSGMSQWHGGVPLPTEEAGEDVTVTAEETDTTVTSTTATVTDTLVEGQDACLSAAGDLIDLPQTGQTVCSDASGVVIPCAGTGQDGDVRAGAPWPNPRFVDNGDGTVTDMLTGLVWLKDANYARTVGYDPDDPDPDGRMNWRNALDFVAVMNVGQAFSNFGHNDWRVPNINEMESLVHSGVTDPVDWLAAHGFGNVATDYWSSTTKRAVAGGGDAYAARLARLLVRIEKKTQNYAVWPVRGGCILHPDPAYPANVWKTGQKTSLYPGDDGYTQAGVAWPVPRFTDHGDGTVTDKLTGLMWLKDANCFGGRPWMDALAAVGDFNTGNRVDYPCEDYTAEYTDWHLPNRKEGMTLLDQERETSGVRPALPLGHPFVNWGGEYWSSDSCLTFVGAYDDAWTFTPFGWMSWKKKIYGYRVWPVRRGAKCFGDCDKDGDVDGADFAAFIADFGADDPEGYCSADFNRDGHVDGQDLSRFASNLGRTNCPLSPVE